MTEFEQQIKLASYAAEFGGNHYSSFDLGEIKYVVTHFLPVFKWDKPNTLYVFFDTNGNEMFRLKEEDDNLKILIRNICVNQFVTLL